MRENENHQRNHGTAYYTFSGGTPSHGLRKVESSHIMTPRLKISHFSVKGLLRMSSGAIHSGVPADEVSFMFSSVIILESPKSQILTVQCLSTRQLALFRSRWTTFIRCMHIKPLKHPIRNTKQHEISIHSLKHIVKGNMQGITEQINKLCDFIPVSHVKEWNWAYLSSVEVIHVCSLH